MPQDDSRPPEIVQTVAVPAQAMHLRNPRRSTPSEASEGTTGAGSGFNAPIVRSFRSGVGNDNLSDHVGVDRAVVPERAGGGERVPVRLAVLECLRAGAVGV